MITHCPSTKAKRFRAHSCKQKVCTFIENSLDEREVIQTASQPFALAMVCQIN